MKLYVGITDYNWYRFLSSQPQIDEVNFWQPSPTPFKRLQPGELFLFKLHSPRDYIVGGGFFVSYSIIPVYLAWSAFEEKNGAPTEDDMYSQIAKYRRTSPKNQEDFRIGCIILTQPFFIPESKWFKLPEWSPNIVQGKTFDLNESAGKELWEKASNFIKGIEFPSSKFPFGEKHEEIRYGSEYLIKPRLGQGAFRVLVTDAYNRSCAVTREKALPVLEAAHIKPFKERGPHAVNNGLLLRSDMHKLFDKGYLTITPSRNIEVSRRIKEEFDNGEYYFTFHGRQIHTPHNLIEQPSPEFLTWHNEKIFRG
ncbi:MAG: HNH endonuclease [Candidatus Aminicenantes bacterium]|nr:HNH endonuclease [Candidatus Aminicenantes bacterium]